MYTATIIVLGKKYQGEGSSKEEALSKLSVPNPKGKSILTVDSGENSRERILSPYMTARLFNPSPTVRNVALKQTASLFD